MVQLLGSSVLGFQNIIYILHYLEYLEFRFSRRSWCLNCTGFRLTVLLSQADRLSVIDLPSLYRRLTVFLSWVNRLWNGSRSSLECQQVIFGTSVGRLWNVSRSSLERQQVVFGTSVGCLWNVSRSSLERQQVVSGTSLGRLWKGHLWDISLEEMLRFFISNVGGNYQNSFRFHLKLNLSEI